MLDTNSLYRNEESLLRQYKIITGVDEAGRGPIAGPVVVSAVILNHQHPIPGINDSKQLSAARREKLYTQITENSLAYSIIEIPHQRIDEINILQAVLEGMKQAIFALSMKPRICLIDGNKVPEGIKIMTLACVKGDSLYASIAAASILAKVHRDRFMTEQDIIYPEYGFKQHKGYPTARHLKALQEYGPCPIHRLTYAPVRQLEIWNRKQL
jgi:ribonuclease HII